MIQSALLVDKNNKALPQWGVPTHPDCATNNTNDNNNTKTIISIINVLIALGQENDIHIQHPATSTGEIKIIAVKDCRNFPQRPPNTTHETPSPSQY